MVADAVDLEPVSPCKCEKSRVILKMQGRAEPYPGKSHLVPKA